MAKNRERMECMRNTFVSVVYIVNKESSRVADHARLLVDIMKNGFDDFELIVLDSGSDRHFQDLSFVVNKEQIPNVTCIKFPFEVDYDKCVWHCYQRAIGDFVVVCDPQYDDAHQIIDLVAAGKNGHDAVFASTPCCHNKNLLTLACATFYAKMFGRVYGVDINLLGRFRLVSRSLINLMAKTRCPHLSQKALPAILSENKQFIPSKSVEQRSNRGFVSAFYKAVELLMLTGKGPLRCASMLCLCMALFNLSYSVYAVAVYMLKSHVADGWLTLSLQNGTMGFMLSICFFFLCEYLFQRQEIDESNVLCADKEFTSPLITMQNKSSVETDIK